ncbi:MAG: putative toxin-antitoxin system toxin component, PIN family [Candidatus Muproteobacteria bacterium RBG_16_64_11]|uniref:Putative toxin-antitoxin system toxin component, PIN family n=1 Tax=Candidatus Muproteobacteria bacterium RBG_16_64_11 TaxID=1817758 RepID=A0A1F6TE45_9PROT|nr:MAG: putative toxin-antitoxin system toxin component, PIN family [Candidatus Muproteobacteria bacterium RBG_16_64_11]
MRVVLDTNVLLSGFMYPGSAPGKVVRAWREARLELVLTVEQLTEIGRVLNYPKIRKILKWDRATIEGFLRQLYLRSELVDIVDIAVSVPSDPDDNFILAALIAGQAECLVTGDADLLALRDRYPILTPAEFAKRL